MAEMKERCLAILFFNQEYQEPGTLTNTSRFEELPGVEEDRIELTEFLSEYKQIVIKHVENVLEELQYLIKDRKGEKFERVHFHFTGVKRNGECVVGTSYACALHAMSSTHDITLELLKLDTDLITMTLDCCREVTREPVVSLHDRGDISDAQHKKLFIFKAARATCLARDYESFTRTLVSVCKEHGGALPILDIEKKVNLKMRNQKCQAVRVLGGNTNWEDFYWPQDVRKLDQEVLEMLQRLDLMEHEEVFKEQELSLSDIAELDHEALRSIGIRLVKHRTAIIKYTSASGTQSEYEGPQPEQDQQSNLVPVGLPPPDSQSLFPDYGSRTPSAPAYHLVEEHGVEDPPAYSSLFPSTSQPQVQPQTGAEARPGEGSSQSSRASVILTSTGPSADWRGGCLGVFDYLQEYNECPAYRQRHSVANTQPYYLYRDDKYGNWRVGRELGGSSSGLLNRTKSDSVPSTNWLYADGPGPWPSDPELTVSTSLPSVCPVINISLHGAAARAQPRAEGEYRPTGEWSAGHPVFSNGDLYLCVVLGKTSWGVTDSLDSECARLHSGSVTWCPTSPRAALSQRLNISSWLYYDSGWRDGDIRMTPDTKN